MTQGGRANKFGQVLEINVEATLQKHGYFKVGHNLPKKQQREYILNYTLLPKRYARQVYIGSGVYETDIYVDFYVIGVDAVPSGLIIECKWQQIGGSVDEKFPYLNLNIKDCYPAPAVVVIDQRSRGAVRAQGRGECFLPRRAAQRSALVVRGISPTHTQTSLGASLQVWVQSHSCIRLPKREPSPCERSSS